MCLLQSKTDILRASASISNIVFHSDDELSGAKAQFCFFGARYRLLFVRKDNQTDQQSLVANHDHYGNDVEIIFSSQKGVKILDFE